MSKSYFVYVSEPDKKFGPFPEDDDARMFVADSILLDEVFDIVGKTYTIEEEDVNGKAA